MQVQWPFRCLSVWLSHGPLLMKGLHIAVCSVAPTVWLSTHVFSVMSVACCTECSVAPTVAAPQPDAPSSVHKRFDASPHYATKLNIDRATVAPLEAQYRDPSSGNKEPRVDQSIADHVLSVYPQVGCKQPPLELMRPRVKV